MRGLVILVVAAALLFLVYHFYFENMPSTDQGAAPTGAITLTGIRSDLLEIAQAERSYIALNGRCASLAELLSSSTLPVPHTERDGYAYSVACSSAVFKVTARHLPAAAGSAIRYPQLAIDQSLQIREIN